MNIFEQIAKWIISESDDPITEIEILLKNKYKNENELKNDFPNIVNKEF